MFHKIYEIIFIWEYLEGIYRIFYLTQIKIISRSACISTKSLNENKKESLILQPDLLGFIRNTIKKETSRCLVRKISFSYKDMKDYISPNSKFPLFPRNMNNPSHNL